MSSDDHSRITFRALLLGTLAAAAFAVLTAYCENRKYIYLSATQVAVLPYALLLLTVGLINPLCRLLRVIRRFSATEILIVFIMGTVSAGISTFGLASQLGPVFSSLFNEHWNDDQSEWNLYVEPFVSERFFLSEPGIQQRAQVYYTALTTFRQTRSTYEAALNLDRADAGLAEAEAALEALESQRVETPDAELQMQINRARQALGTAQAVHQEMQTRWGNLAGSADLDVAKVVATYPELIDQQDATAQKAKADLRELEEKAFAKVAVFRRGLPPEKSAFPGFFYRPGDTWKSYRQRYARFRAGLRGLKSLNAAIAALPEGGKLSSADAGPVADHLDAAIAAVETVDIGSDVAKDKAAVDQAWEQSNTEYLATNQLIKDLRGELRDTKPRLAGPLKKRLAREIRLEKKLTKRKDRLTLAREQLQVQLQISARLHATLEAMRGLTANLEDGGRDAVAVEAQLVALRPEFRFFDASWQRYLVGDIPWGDILRPLAYWGLLIALTYIMLMTFNVLIFRQWAYNEKLIYPLAELPELMTVSDDESKWFGLPTLYRNPLFWLGFTISTLVIGWGLLCALKPELGLVPLDLQNKWGRLVKDTPFESLTPNARSEVFFTMLGLAFLIPAKISFSLWFFMLLYFLQVLIMCWLGYGQNENSFRAGWWYSLNFRSAEGAGALMVFALVIIYKCRHYLLCALRPKKVENLEAPERQELRLSSLLFLVSSAALILVLWRVMGANLWYTLFAYLVIMMITIGLVRAVAEGGILGFQAWVSPFHFVRTLFGMDKAWTSPSLFAPLFIYYSIFFLDIKTFVAPAMANCIKIRDDLKMNRRWFHLAVIACILTAVLVSVVTHLILTYHKGGDAMNSWFYTGFPRGLYNQIAAMTKTQPVDTSNNIWFVGSGALIMGLLLYLRQMIFWLPHPIGLIMLVNPIMNAYWFSILLGWLAKSLVTRYGNKDTYRQVRTAFVGLIVGELLIVILAVVFSIWFETSISISLNRN